ncbi:MAG TPA: XRE family transcriptional regulator [Steroidobacteraceae bacterium]|nr:XRE family transcriptional regulator [Steroidobacteraceae bacterium]
MPLNPLKAPKAQHALDINERIARQLLLLREERGISPEELAERSGVSRAMIYRIESNQANPTAVVLNKLATGLGVLLPTLLGPGDYREPRLNLRHPVASRRAQATWQDPDTGYSRRTLTPSTADTPLQLSEIHFPAGARVTFENAFGEARVHQQIWMLDGQMDIRLGDEVAHLKGGDCMAMRLDAPITFHNPGGKTARYLVAITRSGG